MVKLDKIYTRAGDGGKTRLATGELVDKWSTRIEANGAVDETNCMVGAARLSTAGDFILDPMLSRIQNDLFDLGADLSTPASGAVKFEPLRILPAQVERLEREIDMLNADLAPLTSFVLPAGSPLATSLHLARATCRRAERLIAKLSHEQPGAVSPAALHYANRLSDLLFVAARWANAKAGGDVLWVPGKNR
ncbi:MAG TPA: cob(I)yrinic acid a,c-diamide adenosyltransferase [Caulobacterales bacterium]|nr:cob(I)yrinic acid a,c-diamide adenosyltransferase [Caulobacterales bacterium]